MYRLLHRHLVNRKPIKRGNLYTVRANGWKHPLPYGAKLINFIINHKVYHDKWIEISTIASVFSTTIGSKNDFKADNRN